MYKVITYKARLYETPAASLEDSYTSYGTELLYGEQFDVFETQDGWVRGKSMKDDYEGWLKIESLQQRDDNKDIPKAYITLKEALVYKGPHLKSVVVKQVPFCGVIETGISKNDYIYSPDLKGWIPDNHLINCAMIETPHSPELFIESLVDTAFTFIGCPYLYGGCTSRGIDCSALVQLAFQMLGVAIPRDSTPQKEFLADRQLTEGIYSKAIKNDVSVLQKGDIVFFPGHIGVMFDDKHLLHASGKMMKVCVQPIDIVDAHYQLQEGQGITAIRRLIAT
jgi:hypothetical protein